MALLELDAVTAGYVDTIDILNELSLRVEPGTITGIIGPNGAGKSTLFNLVSGRYPLSTGSILLNGEDITGLRPYEINRKGLSRSFQVTNIFHNLSVYENVRCGVLWAAGYRYSFWHRVGGLRDVAQRAEEVMERIGLAKRRNVLAGTLTYAEQRALEIGITIAGGASVILLDEPTAGMSRTETAQAVSSTTRESSDVKVIVRSRRSIRPRGRRRGTGVHAVNMAATSPSPRNSNAGQASVNDGCCRMKKEGGMTRTSVAFVLVA